MLQMQKSGSKKVSPATALLHSPSLLSHMLRVCSALSGEEVAVLEADEVEGKTVKMLKMHLAETIGASRFRQRWYSYDQREVLDDELVSDLEVQLVLLSFVTPEFGQDWELVSASATNHFEEVEALLLLPIDPDGTDEEGSTALHYAAWAGHSPCVSLLLEANADVDKEDFSGATALYWATEQGYVEVVQLLLEAGADKDRLTHASYSALHVAAWHGRLEILQLLLQAKCDKDLLDDDGLSALGGAAMAGHTEAVQMLLETGFDQSSGVKPLLMAAANGHSDVVKLLLEAGTDKDAAELAKGHTALHGAAFGNQRDIVWLLLEARADKDKVTIEGRTPLHIASQYGCEDVVQLLLQARADKDAADLRGVTALHLAENPVIVKMLLVAGALKEKKTLRRQETPLHLAASMGKCESVWLLLLAGRDMMLSAGPLCIGRPGSVMVRCYGC